MALREAFQAVRPSVVAFMPAVVPRRPEDHGKIFPIIGTGVILGDGLIATNAHVIDALIKLPRPDDFPKDKLPFKAVLFHRVGPGDNEAITHDSVAEVPLEVIGVFTVAGQIPRGEGFYYGPEKPDFSIVRVKAKGLPKVTLDGNAKHLIEGIEVGTIGYPMGTDALCAPGWVHQFGPFLQRGILSAVLPTRCDAPHAFVINLASMGGASGSPVFRADDGRVIGILNAGLIEPRPILGSINNQVQQIGFTTGATNFTYVVPAYYLTSALGHISQDERFALPPDTPTLAEIIRGAPARVRPGSGQIKPLAEVSDSRDTFDVHVEPVSFGQ